MLSSSEKNSVQVALLLELKAAFVRVSKQTEPIRNANFYKS